jgi:hypothetical protein
MFLSVTLGLAGVGTAAAQGQITRLIVAADENATSGLQTLPIGTTSMWAIFDYERAGDSDFGVIVMSPGGSTVFSQEDAYSGSGTARVEITGADMYENIMAELTDLAEATETALVKIATQQQVKQYASDAISGVSSMASLTDLVEATGYRGLDEQQLSSLTSSMDSLTALKAELSSAASDEDKRAKAAEMEPHVATAVAAIDALSSESVPDFPIPPSPRQAGGAEYLVKIEVDGYPSRSAEVWVFGDAAVDESDDLTGGTPTQQPAGGLSGTAGRGTAVPPGSTAATGDTIAEGGEFVPASGTPGAGALVPNGGATATSLAALGQSAGEAPPPVMGEALGGAAAFGAEAQQPDEAANPAAPTAYVVRGVSGGPAAAGETDNGSSFSLSDGSGPNFAILLVGVVVLAGVAVFMKGRM